MFPVFQKPRYNFCLGGNPDELAKNSHILHIKSIVLIKLKFFGGAKAPISMNLSRRMHEGYCTSNACIHRCKSGQEITFKSP